VKAHDRLSTRPAVIKHDRTERLLGERLDCCERLIRVEPRADGEHRYFLAQPRLRVVSDHAAASNALSALTTCNGPRLINARRRDTPSEL
jgi:hypothetical protein